MGKSLSVEQYLAAYKKGRSELKRMMGYRIFEGNGVMRGRWVMIGEGWV